VVAHIGDDYGQHGALIPRLRDLDAVGIFHDAFLAGLAWSWAYLPGGAGEEALRSAVRDTYGEESWHLNEPFLTAETMQEVAGRRPMLEWLAPQTIAAVAHADHYVGRLQNSCPGPVKKIPLAMTFLDLPSAPPRWSRMTIAVIGHANPNKRIDQLILAVAASPMLRQCCRIRVIGYATDEDRNGLTAHARALEIPPPEFTGSVSEEELRWQLRDIDVICCLRYPVLEGASASLLLALSSGRPTLVSNHGCYAELPEGIVMACTPGAEALDVMRHLESLVAEPGAGVAMGLRAQAAVTRFFSPAVYVTSLLPLFYDVIATRPVRLMKQHLRATMSDFGLPPNSPLTHRVEACLAEMQPM